MIKVLEKQRQIQLDSWTSRRGTVTDPDGDLQQYAARHSRHCRERAQRLAASDAKEARAVYKESLRRTNLHASSGSSVMSGSSQSNTSYYSSSRHYSHHHHDQTHHHKNDIFQEYCRRQHLATKARLQQQAVM